MGFFIAAVALIIFGGHVAVYAFISSALNIHSGWVLTAMRIGVVVLAFSFVVASLIASRYDSVITRVLYTGSAIWLGMLFYLFLAACMYGVIWVGGRVISPETDMTLAGKILLSIALAVSAYGVIHARDIRVTRIEAHIPHLPLEWKDSRAVFVSDVHLGQVHNIAFARKVSAVIDELDPDIIFIGGDLYDGIKTDISGVIAPFKGLHPRRGIYFITGNHEEFSSPSAYIKAIEDIGIKVLRDEAVEVDGMQIIGVDYETTRKPEAFARVLEKIGVKKESILLKHTPFDLEVARNAGVGMQMSGHTHRAQMFPLSLITKVVYKGYDYGFKKFGDMDVLVSDGVGSWGPPLRVGSNSEIVEVTFK